MFIDYEIDQPFVLHDTPLSLVFKDLGRNKSYLIDIIEKADVPLYIIIYAADVIYLNLGLNLFQAIIMSYVSKTKIIILCNLSSAFYARVVSDVTSAA